MDKEEFLNAIEKYGDITVEKTKEYSIAAGKKALLAKDYIEHYGLVESTRKVAERGMTWENYNDLRMNEIITERELEEQRRNPTDGPKISILVPVWNPTERSFIQMLQSVKSQSYTNWELCIADASAVPMEDSVDCVFAEDSRVNYLALERNEGLASNTNAALELAGGEYIAFLDHDDILEPNALYEVAKQLVLGMDLVYTDEDKVSENLDKYERPFRKPDYNEALLYSTNYICHFCVMRKNLVTEVGGLRTQYDGAQDYDLVLRVMQRIREEDQDVAKHIGHVAKILYHWRQSEESTSGNAFQKEYAFEAGRRALEDSLECRRQNGDTNGYGMKLRVKDGQNLGYYRVVMAETTSMSFAVIPSAKDAAPDNVDYVMIMPDSMEVTAGDLAQLISRAQITNADVVVPKQVLAGKLLYHGVAKAGQGHTISLKGKPAWYHGPYQCVVTNMNIDVAPKEGILIRRKLLQNLSGLPTKHLNRKLDWTKSLNMIYAPEVTITVKK